MANPLVDRYIHSSFAFFADVIRLILRKFNVINAFYAENKGPNLRMDGFDRKWGSLEKVIHPAYFLEVLKTGSVS